MMYPRAGMVSMRSASVFQRFQKHISSLSAWKREMCRSLEVQATFVLATALSLGLYVEYQDKLWALFPLVVIHLVLAEGHLIFGFAKGGRDKTRRCLLTQEEALTNASALKREGEKVGKDHTSQKLKRKGPLCYLWPKDTNSKREGYV